MSFKLPTPKKYPKQIYIGRELYKIKFRPNLDRGASLGRIHFDKRVIYLSKEQHPLEMLQSFIHEVLHAFEEEYDIKLKHKRIEKLEWAIAEFLIANF